MKTKIAILGHFNSSRPPRVTIEPALQHSASAMGIDVESTWLAPDQINNSNLQEFSGFFIGPGDPSEDTKSILQTIRLARTNLIPCLGTCGGFQRMVAEYAFNELGFDTLEHEEISPNTVDPFFSQLKCSLVGQESLVEISPDTLAFRIYATHQANESFFCKYGINGKYLERLQQGHLKVSAHDTSGEARIVELDNHPFFMATLFVPQVRSSENNPHPVITTFLKAVVN